MLKKILKIARNTLIILILIGVGLFFAIQTRPVQTWLSHRLAGYLSDELGAKVEIGGVYIDLWARLEIDDLYLEDQRQDTLIFIPQLYLSDYDLNDITGEVHVKSAYLSNPYFNLKRHQGDTLLNYVFLIDYINGLSSPEDTSHTLIRFDHLQIAAGRMNYINANREASEEPGIDWNRLQMHHLNADLHNFDIVGDSIHAGIHHLDLWEYSGFEVKNLAADFSLTPTTMRLGQATIGTNRSEIHGDLAFFFETTDDFEYFEEKVKMNHTLQPSRLYMDDLAYFSSDLEGWDKEIQVEGKFKGKVSALKGKEVKIVVDENTRFEGSFSMDGLPEIDQTFISMDIDELTTNKTELDRLQIPPFDSLHFLTTPSNFAALGQITYSGNFTGFINDFASIGTIQTAIGVVNTDIALRYDEGMKDYVYKGNLATDNFNLGKFYNSTDLGAMSCDLYVDGKSLELKKMNAEFSGEIGKLHLMGYDYSNITVNQGTFALRQFNGDFTIDDPNASVNFIGAIDFRPTDPILNFDAQIQHINLRELKILPQYDYSSISGDIHVTSVGFEFEKFVGEIILDDVTYCALQNDYHIGHLELKSERRGEPHISMQSEDLINVDIRGQFDANEIVPGILSVLSNTIPSLHPPVREHPTQQFEMEIEINDLSQITEVYVPDLVISKGTRLKLNVDEVANEMKLAVFSGKMSYAGEEFKDVIITGDKFADDPALYFNVKSANANIEGIDFTDINFDTYTEQDSVYADISWGRDTNDPAGNANGSNITDHSGRVNGKWTIHSFEHVDFLLDSSHVRVKNEKWNFIKGGLFTLNKKEIAVNNFEMRNGDQWVKANGAISENPRTPLNFELHEFNIASLNAFTGSETKFYGVMGGTAAIRDAYGELIFTNDITLRDFKLNDYYVGYLCLESAWDNIKRELRIDGTLEKDIQSNWQITKVTPLKFSGYYRPDNEKSPLDIVATVKELDLAFINEFLSPGVIDIRGYASGTIAITGQPESPQMEGEAYLRDASIFVNYLNTRYYLENEIGIYPDMYTFDYIPVVDEDGNRGRLTGQIMHKNFADWNFDINIDLQNPMLAMNTTEALNPLYYGKAYATGQVNIYGYEDQLEFECNLKSEKGTVLSMPMGSTEEQTFDNFVRFVNANDTVKAKPNDLSGIKLNLNMEITPDAEFQIVFDAGVGDVMKGRGKGHLLMDISGLSTFNMYGLVEVVEGDYLFTLQNLLVNKHFTIKPGGTIAWYGDPFAGDLNLESIYKVTASLYDIVPDPRYASGQRVPVDLIMKLTGKMLNPTVEFNVDLPTVDQVTRSRVNSVISTDQERNRQAFALLVLRRFVAPPNVSSDHQSTSALGATSSELLSSQVSNWLSQISDDFNLGFNYRPGDDISNEEIELALSTQLFNDRVSLSTNVGVSRNTSTINQNPNNLIGDIRVEYRIDKSGKVKMVVYNESSDFRMVATQQSPYTQGIGILYQEEFDTMEEFIQGFKDLLKGDRSYNSTR